MTRKKIISGVLSIFGVLILGACIYLHLLLPIITGYAAKNLCSAVFVSGRAQKDVESVDLNFSFIRYTRNRVDYTEKSVTSRFLWGKSRAIYREGFGVTLLRDIPEASLRSIRYPGGTYPGCLRQWHQVIHQALRQDGPIFRRSSPSRPGNHLHK